MDQFVLAAIDPLFGCPTVETLIQSPDIGVMAELIGADAAEDPELRRGYTLNPDQARAVAARFGVAFDPIGPKTRLSRPQSRVAVPYLNHAGYELFLMLEGRKPFAFRDILIPVCDGDDVDDVLFESHVESGRIVKRMVFDSYEPPLTGYAEHKYTDMRRSYYALPSEQWRIDAFLMLWDQAQCGLWSDTLERIEGTLLGYTDAQNDWWLAHLRYEKGANWGRATAYAAIVHANLSWLRASGCRALPWDLPGSDLKLEFRWPRPDAATLQRWLADTGAAAVIWLGLKHEFLEGRQFDLKGDVRTYAIPSDDIPELNGGLEHPIEIIAEPEG